MGRPTTISDSHILDTAREVFLERGIAATTAEVARKAGVAEGSIFKRWPTKQELFYAALTPENAEPEFMVTLASRVGCGDMIENLTDVAMQAIEHFRRILPLIMMSWSNPSTSGLPKHLDMPNSKPVRAIRKLAGFFEAEMHAGRMAKRDAEVVARVFIGSISNFVFQELLSRKHEELPLPAPMFVRGLVHLLWNGLEPDAKPHVRSAKEKVR